MRNAAIIAILALAFVAIGCTQAVPPPEPPETGAVPIPDGAGSEGEMHATHMVEVTAEGFKPNSVTITAGESVTFVNKDAAAHWPASAMHPTHKVYPGTDIENCGGGMMMFDACKELAGGESFEFTFSEKGSWNYHDHLNCCNDNRFFGVVVVE